MAESGALSDEGRISGDEGEENRDGKRHICTVKKNTLMKSVSQVPKWALLAAIFQWFVLPLQAQTAPVILATEVAEDYPGSVDLTLKAYNWDDLVAMQFVLTFDPAQVQYWGFVEFNLPGLSGSNVNFAPPNKIYFSWLAPVVGVGVTLPDGAPLFTIRFTPLTEGSCSFLFDLDSPVIPEFVNGDYLILDYLLLDCSTGSGLLFGNVFADQDSDCVHSAGEPGLGQLLVKIEGGNTHYAWPSEEGAYFFPYLDEDTMTVSLVSGNGLWVGCLPAQEIIISNPGEDVELDLGAVAVDDCRDLSIEITTPFLRPCFQSPYHIHYCNEGTLPVAGTEALVELDAFLSVTGSSIPWSDVSGNAYTFPLGDLDIGECGSFTIQVQVSCDAEPGQTHCSKALILPVEFCDPAPGWDGAELEVRGFCDGDVVRFEIENTGQQAMSAPSGYIVMEDDLIKMIEPFDPLGPGGTLDIALPASGATWRVEVAQVPDFPAPSAPSATVEACDEDGDGDFSLGFVNMYAQDEEASYVSVQCTKNNESWDSNDKAAFPAGYREEHFIRPDTRLEYLIRFQNTGADTAFTVVILDTLSALLDPETLRLQAASHPCQLQVSDGRRLSVTFPDILLPGSTTNEQGSHGFVQFSIGQFPGNSPGEVIENRAAIYFDYNVPVNTNPVFHKLGVDFVQDVSSVGEVVSPVGRLSINPNPAKGPVRISMPGVTAGVVEVFDLAGRKAGEFSFSGGEALLEKGQLPAGAYWAVLKVQGGVVAVGQILNF